MEDTSMSVSEAGRLGGLKRKKTADYRALGRLGGAVTRARYGMAHYADIGHQGGTVTAQKHGSGHYRDMGRKGGQRTAELIKKGRAAG